MGAQRWLRYGQKAALCLLAASVVLGAGCSSAVKSGTFKSPFYGYSMQLPSGWSGTKASSRWDGSVFPGFEDSNVDLFSGPDGVRAFVVGQASGDSLAAYEKKTLQAQAAAHQCPTKPASDQSVTLGSAPARLVGMLCQGLHLQREPAQPTSGSTVQVAAKR